MGQWGRQGLVNEPSDSTIIFMTEETDSDSNDSGRIDTAWRVVYAVIVIIMLIAGARTGFDHEVGLGFLALLAIVMGVRRLHERRTR